MDLALLAARLVLAAVFAVAGLAKLADREGSRRALIGFGVPEPLARPGGIALPFAELAVAGLLLPTSTGSWGALGALVLLLTFVVGIAANLLRGRTPDCHCFGALHSAPAGPKTLARNAALAAVAAFATVRGWNGAGTSAVAWIGRLDVGGAALLVTSVGVAAAMSLGALAFVHLLRQQGRLLLRLDRLEQVLDEAGFSVHVAETMPEIGHTPGTEAPAFALKALDGSEAALASLLEQELPVLLVFTSPTCGPCHALMPSVARWQRIHSSVVTIAVVSAGTESEIRTEVGEHELEHVLVDTGHELYHAYQANGTPSAVLIGTDGKIASWMASGNDWIERLLTDALAGTEPELGTPVGEPAPSVDLTYLDGKPVALADTWNGDTVVLFWNPTCGFCRSMHPDLVAWEVTLGESSPRLVIVSAGEADEVRAEGFRSTVLLDPEWSASAAFQAGGTPMAVRIDGEGRIASRPGAGAEAVFELLQAPVATSG